MENDRQRAIQVYRQFGPTVRTNIDKVIAIGVSQSALLYRVGENDPAMQNWANEYMGFGLDIHCFTIGSDGNLEDTLVDIGLAP